MENLNFKKGAARQTTDTVCIQEKIENGNSPETAKYQECTPASRFTGKFILRLATGTDTRGDVPTQSR